MAARTRAREESRHQAEIAELEKLLPADDSWLNGWYRAPGGTTVLIGTGVHCVACGRCHGITCVAFEPNWEPPGPEPDWPFPQEECPVRGCKDWSPTYSASSF